MTIVALVMCGCEKDDNNPNSDNNTPVISVTPYLGTYLMTRHSDLTITALNMFSFPLDRDFNVERVTVKEDPNVEHGIIMTSTDGMYLRGVVDTNGLRLQNDTVNLAIDTTVGAFPINASVNITMVHPIIPTPVNGKMEWTSTASGTLTIPVMGVPLSATITGNMRYKSILSTK